jgi:phosphate transport system substrate-binding protein
MNIRQVFTAMCAEVYGFGSKSSGILVLALLGSLVLSLGSVANAGDLKWTGCGITKKAFMKELAQAYEQKTGIAIKLSGGGASKGIRTASAGTTDIGGTCRHWLKDVNSEINPQERDAELIQVAWDALVVIVHPYNEVDDISVEQLKQIYQGKISKWSEVGGADRPIGVIARDGKTSGVGYMFRQLVFSDPEYTIKARALRVKSSGPLEKKVEKIKTAIAIDGISSAKKRKVKFLSLDGVVPTKENIAAGKYSLFRPLYLAINKSKASAETKKFIEYALSPEGQAIISEQGTVNLQEGEALNAMWEAKKARVGL